MRLASSARSVAELTNVIHPCMQRRFFLFSFPSMAGLYFDSSCCKGSDTAEKETTQAADWHTAHKAQHRPPTNMYCCLPFAADTRQ